MTRACLFRIVGRLALSLCVAIPLSSADDIIERVRASFATGSDGQAIEALRTYRTANGVTPEFLEAYSWLARVELKSRNYEPAEKFAQDIYAAAVAQLKSRPMDREPHLPIALGAAIEIQSELFIAQGRRSEAVSYLQEQLKTFANTSIITRVRKNLLLADLEGKPAPPLENVTLPKGKPALIFFWAHWCADCKAEIPILTQIMAEFGPQGLALLAPTQKYGYMARGQDAKPAEETAYIEQIRRAYYGGVIKEAAPVSEANFVRYGVSTTPTLVLVDAAGIVRTYHPDKMTYAALRTAVQGVMNSKGGTK